MKWYALASALLTWPLISFGALVRLHGAGLSCPDWPLCYGQLIPPPGFEIAMEVGHRFWATLLGLLIVMMTLLSFRIPAYRSFRRLTTACLILVVLQGILGALTVTMVLWPPVVTFHLIGGESPVCHAGLSQLDQLEPRHHRLGTNGTQCIHPDSSSC